MSKDKYLLVGFGKRTTSDEKKNVILQTKGHLFQSKKCFIFLFCFFVWKTLTLLSCYWLNVFSLVNRLPGVSCWHLATTQWQQPPEKVSSCRRELFTHKKQAHKTTMSAFFMLAFLQLKQMIQSTGPSLAWKALQSQEVDPVFQSLDGNKAFYNVTCLARERNVFHILVCQVVGHWRLTTVKHKEVVFTFCLYFFQQNFKFSTSGTTLRQSGSYSYLGTNTVLFWSDSHGHLRSPLSEKDL